MASPIPREAPVMNSVLPRSERAAVPASAAVLPDIFAPSLAILLA
jgi:hypothetical protein